MAVDPAFRDRLSGEVTEWIADGTVDQRTASRILARYGLRAPVGEPARRRGGGIVAGLGALLTGLGVLLFVASNWPSIGRVERLVILLVALVAAYGASDLLLRRGMRRTAAAFVTVGTLIFGASVFLVGQTYHLSTTDPLLPLLWSAGALAMAFAVVSRPSFVIGVIALAAGYVMLWQRWGAFNDVPFIVIASLWWGMAGIALSVLLSRADATRPFFGALTALAVPVTVVVLVALGFKDMWRSFGGIAPTMLPSTPLRVSAAIAAIVLLASLARLVWTSILGRREAVTFAVAAVVTVGAPAALLVWHPFTDPVAYAIVMNALILGVVIASVFYGIRIGREAFVNAGLVLFAITVFSRYVDFAFTLFDRSLVFVGAGLLLLALGLGLERGRRQILARSVEAHGVA